MSELLPCPFCGGKAGYDYPDGCTYKKVYVRCRNGCHAKTHWYPSEEQAAQEWNTRARPVPERTCTIKPSAVEIDSGFYDCMECCECGYVAGVDDWEEYAYCPSCGAKVI